MFRASVVLAALGIAVLFSSNARAGSVLFSDDFESGNLSQWTGKSGGAFSGHIIADPLNPANHVVDFTALTGAGDMFTASSIGLTGGGSDFVLDFDYLGLARSGSVPGDLGGFIGISKSLHPTIANVDHFWLAGTETPTTSNGMWLSGQRLFDDGAWHHYSIDFSPIVTANSLTSIHVMFEDYDGSLGVPGDAYFDNIAVSSVPEPTSIVGWSAWLLAVPVMRLKRFARSLATGAIAFRFARAARNL